MNNWNWANAPLNVWGPIGWHWLHLTARNYPDKPTKHETQTTYAEIINFVDHIPCVECKQHAKNYIRTNKIWMHNSEHLQFWAFKFHNSVNAKLGKKEMTYSTFLIKSSARRY